MWDAGIGIMTFSTLGFMVAFGYLGVRAVEKARKDGVRSTLAADTPNTRAELEKL